MNTLTQERLKEVIEYDKDTGTFTWKMNLGSRARKGSMAGASPNTTGYTRIMIDNEHYLTHRLAWLYHYGVIPPRETDIDHVNGIRTDNRIENLRLASRSENNYNSKLNSNNRSGRKGITWIESRQKWRARLTYSNQKSTNRYFTDIEEAQSWLNEIRQEEHKEFARI